MITALFPGSFDPLHNGHFEVIEIAARSFDRVVIASIRNPGKDPLFTHEESVRLYAAYATEVLGVSLSNYLNGYVARGEITSGEAQEMLVEACELGLGVEPLNAGAAARPSHT